MTAGNQLKVAIKSVVGLKGKKDVRVLRGPARGVRMTLDFSGHTPMYLGMFEWELHRFFHSTLPQSRLVFDVGGYVGYDALMFAANSPGRVVTFEPNQAQAKVLLANVEQNPELAARIDLSPLAVSSRNDDGVATLDAIASEVGAADMVKIDIDGGELDALRGGSVLFSERRPHLVVETHTLELEEECGRLLLEFGYRPIIKHNRRIWREHRAGAAHNRWLLAYGNDPTAV